jgi:hypothetical protein
LGSFCWLDFIDLCHKIFGDSGPNSYGFGSYGFGSYGFGSYDSQGSYIPSPIELMMLSASEPLNMFGYGIDII